MDLNYLYSRHQISLMSADVAITPEAKLAHLGLAAGYADRIRAHQQSAGSTAMLSDPV